MSPRVGQALKPVELICKADGLPMPEAEVRFEPTRRWRLDWAWPDYKVAVEIEGGVWIRGRHTRAKGYIGDMEKYSQAAILGWCVIRILPQQIPQVGELVGRALITRGYPAPGAVDQGTVSVQGASVVSARSGRNTGKRSRNSRGQTPARGTGGTMSEP